MSIAALTAGLPAGEPRISAKPADYRPHFTHQPERIWLETNCYLDLWIEILHSQGLDPVPSLACLLSADFDGLQWSFAKQRPEDLRRLYGVEVTEENVWLPVLETVLTGPGRGILHTVEVDSWWLPDTAGTAYRSEHVKTTIVPTHVDQPARTLWYLHNAGLYELGGDDFDGVFGLRADARLTLPPYIEQIRHHQDRIEPDALPGIVIEQLRRRPADNPVAGLVAGVHRAVDWLPEAGIEHFHRWSFATLRQCGATAELLADHTASLDGTFAGCAAAGEHFLRVATAAKSVQFKMARVASGRTVAIEPLLDEMVDAWSTAMDLVAGAVD